MCLLRKPYIMKNFKCVVATHKLRCQLNPPKQTFKLPLCESSLVGRELVHQAEGRGSNLCLSSKFDSFALTMQSQHNCSNNKDVWVGILACGRYTLCSCSDVMTDFCGQRFPLWSKVTCDPSALD